MDPYTILVAQIRDGVYPPGARLASERALAEAFGVDRGTIRRVLARLAGESFIERRPGCRPVVRAIASPPVDSSSVALILGNADPFRNANLVMRGCEAELRDAGYRMVYINTFAEAPQASAERERAALEDLLENPVAGLVVWPHAPDVSLPLLEELRQRGMAITVIEHPVASMAMDFVGVDEANAGREAAEHLLGLGHRRIALVTRAGEAPSVRERVRGFMDSLRRHGVTLAEENIVHLPAYPCEPREAGPSGDPLGRIVSPLVEADRPTAILATNDTLARAAVMACRTAGLRVPRDVSVLGFQEMGTSFADRPAVTSVQHSFDRLGRQAARQVVRRLRDASLPAQQIFLDTAIEEGDTTSEARNGSAPERTHAPGDEKALGVQRDVHASQMEMPVGLYTIAAVGTTACGLANRERIIGYLHDPRAFYHPDRATAQILWAAEGYVEYVFPKDTPLSAQIRRLEVSFEVCSETLNYANDYPSDITVWVNATEIGTWTSPGDFGGRRGRLNPSWWSDWFTQYGILKTWSVDGAGSFIDGVPACDATLSQLRLEDSPFITVRLGVKPDARHRGGFNLFGRGFGNHEQDILLRLVYSSPPPNLDALTSPAS